MFWLYFLLLIGDGDVLRRIVVGSGANAFVPEVKIIIIMEKSSTVGAIIFFIIDVMFVISVVNWKSEVALWVVGCGLSSS